MNVRRSLPLLALFGFLALAATPLAALPADTDPACPAEAFLSTLATPEVTAEPAQLAGFLPAPTPAAACPANFCARQLQLCLQGCPCGFIDCDAVACTSQCICPIFCPDES